MNRNYAITSLLEVLDAMLHEAAEYTTEALAAIQSGNKNLAIGTLLYIEETLPAAQALYAATLILHRQARPAQEGGAQ
jgi:hypothetical protein